MKIPAIFAIAAVALHAANSSAQTSNFKFKFEPGQPPPGFTAVTPEMTYSAERGFGFEAAAENPTNHAATNGEPFYFSVALPEGNYRVKATLGSAQTTRIASDTTVKAELRRLMLEHVCADAGKYETRSFTVNVRRPGIPSGGSVRLTDREKTTETRAWDDRLTLEFDGPHPALASLEIEKADVPTVYLIGDSTVCDQPREPFASWGQMLPRFFKPSVAVANHAESGESIGGALAKKRFEKIWNEMKKGDYLFVQFGHNDMKSTAPNALDTYTENLRQVVEETRRRGGIPVLCTPVSRRSFDERGKITNSFRGYPDAVRLVAREKHAPLIDLQSMGAAFYEAMGPEASHRAFANARENTHHSDYGSYEIAKCVLQGIKDNRLELAGFIVDDFGSFDPSHPDAFESFKVPASPAATTQTPPGS